MNLGDVVLPVDDSRVEVERGTVVVAEGVPQCEQVVDLVDRFTLGVEAVELDVLLRGLDLGPLVVERRGELGLAAAQRERVEHLLGAGEHCHRTVELALDLAAPGEVPLGHQDRLTLGVVQRVLGEPTADVVDHRPVLERVHAARCDLGDRRGPLGAGRGDADDRCDHDVDRDHVDGAFRHPRELLEEAAGVGDDHRLGHAEPANPVRVSVLPTQTR